MAVASVVSGKGGVGKSTTVLNSAAAYAKAGVPVTIIDSDPNQPIARYWSSKQPIDTRPNIKIVGFELQDDGSIDAGEIREAIAVAAEKTPMVLVDAEGIQSKSVGTIIRASDLCILPMRMADIELHYVAEVVRAIEAWTRVSGLIPFSLLFNDVPAAVLSRGNRAVANAVRREEGIHVFDTEIIHREPYNAIWSYGLPVYELPPDQVLNLDKAIANVNAYFMELHARVQAVMATNGVAA